MRTLALALIALLWSAPALAEVLDTTASLAPGHLRLSAGAELGLADPNPIRLDLQERIGLASGLDLHLVQSIGLRRESGARLGAGLKWTVLSRNRERPGIALWGGGFFQTAREVAGATGRVLLDYGLGRFVPYAGLDLDLWFEDGVDPRLSLLGGLRIGVASSVGIFVEAGAGLTGRTKDHIAAVGLAVQI